ncbi:MAG: zinc ribbon domain-containing protein [Phormidesmis sp.]
MPSCPRCDRPITQAAIRCPHCELELTAHGHPGMTLHRATSPEPLCTTCAYEADNSCNFPKRPHAMTCTLYQNLQTQPELSQQEIYRMPTRKKQGLWIALAVLIMLSLIVSAL